MQTLGRAARRATADLLTRRWIKFGFLAVAPVLVVGLVVASYRAIDRDLTEAALSRRQSLAYLTAQSVEERFDRLTDVAVSLSTRVRFRQLVGAGKWREAIEILKDIPQSFPFIDRVTLNDTSGTLMADSPLVPAVRGRNFSQRDWYKGVSQNWEPYVSNVFRRAAEPRINVVGVAAPIRDDAGQVRGILMLQVKLGTLFDWATGVELGDEGFVNVVDRSGTIASYPNFPESGELENLAWAQSVQRALRGERGVETLPGPGGGEARLVAYEPIPKYGWAVIMGHPKSVAFAAKDRLLNRSLFAFGLILVLLAAIAYMAYRVLAERRQSQLAQEHNAELERRVAERTAQLAAANKDLEGFSYSVSHDLRAPLRAIEGFARIVGEDYHDRLDAEGQRYLKIVIDNCRKMTQLIDDLLTFSRLGRQPIAAAVLDMTQLVQEVAAEVHAPAAGAGLVIKPLPRASGDRALLRQVWTNLLSNAVKFTARHATPHIEVGGAAANGEAVYYVKDNGAGFNMAYYQKLFGVFQRLHSTDEYPGTGVGLAIVHRVVTRHGGRVWAEGKEGEGATFYFALPAQAG